MLSATDNDLLTHVGPGTPMGDLMRQYWMPAIQSAELPDPDGDPVRLRLLGETDDERRRAIVDLRFRSGAPVDVIAAVGVVHGSIALVAIAETAAAEGSAATVVVPDGVVLAVDGVPARANPRDR